MAFEYGFYDAVDHDRVYENRQLSEMFNGIILDGVFEYYPINGSNTNNDKYFITQAGEMSIYIGTGMAWFNSTWTLNTEKIKLTLSGSDQNKDRYDLVVLEIRDTRANSISVIEGEPSFTPVKPTPIIEEGLHQYPLAYIMVHAGATEIIADDIENMIGTEATPYTRNIAEDVYDATANRLDITEYGYMLDARQGKVLNDKISSQNATISAIKNGATTQTNYINTNFKAKYKGENIAFRFGVSGGKYGYYKLENGKYVFSPFIDYSIPPQPKIVNLGQIKTYDASIAYPDLYKLLTVDNFFVDIKKISLTHSNAYNEDKEFTDSEAETLWWKMNAFASLNIALNHNTYRRSTGIFELNGELTSKNTLTYKLGLGDDPDHTPSSKMFVNWSDTITLSITEYDVYLIAEVLSS